MNLSASWHYGRHGLLPSADQKGNRLRAGFDSLTLNGVWLFVIGLSVVASGIRAARPSIAGLLLQPYLVPVLLAMPYVLLTRLQELPMRVLIGLFLFSLMFAMTALKPGSYGAGAKLAATMAAMATVALLVRSRADFIAGTTGFMLAIAALAVRGLESETELGVEAIDVANKNSYSLYALPALLLGGFVLLRIKPKLPFVRLLLLFSGLASLVAIFMSGNRSGYLGAVLIALLLVRERKIVGLLLVGLVVAAVSYLLIHYGSTEILERRLQQTVEGTSSDTLRINLLKTCVKIGLANPIAGVSPGDLNEEIGRNISDELEAGAKAPHNVFGLIIGGSGLICFATLILLGWSLWTWPEKRSPHGERNREFIEARKLLRYMLILWVVRGMFNDEIIYIPGFCIGMGLAMGLCLAAAKIPMTPTGSARVRPPALAA